MIAKFSRTKKKTFEHSSKKVAEKRLKSAKSPKKREKVLTKTKSRQSLSFEPFFFLISLISEKKKQKKTFVCFKAEKKQHLRQTFCFVVSFLVFLR